MPEDTKINHASPVGPFQRNTQNSHRIAVGVVENHREPSARAYSPFLDGGQRSPCSVLLLLLPFVRFMRFVPKRGRVDGWAAHYGPDWGYRQRTGRLVGCLEHTERRELEQQAGMGRKSKEATQPLVQQSTYNRGH
ncbi:unnamed protein product [Calypogeia fissa]